MAKRKFTQPEDLASIKERLEKANNLDLAVGLDAMKALVTIVDDPPKFLSMCHFAAVIECVRFQMQSAKNEIEFLCCELTNTGPSVKTVAQEVSHG